MPLRRGEIRITWWNMNFPKSLYQSDQVKEWWYCKPCCSLSSLPSHYDRWQKVQKRDRWVNHLETFWTLSFRRGEGFAFMQWLTLHIGLDIDISLLPKELRLWGWRTGCRWTVSPRRAVQTHFFLQGSQQGVLCTPMSICFLLCTQRHRSLGT